MFSHYSIPMINQMRPNSVLQQDGYHISYNGSSLDYGCPTTALVVRNDLFLILCGDHRDAMQAANDRHGFDGCFDYFMDHIDQAHDYSDHLGIANNQIARIGDVIVYNPLRSSIRHIGPVRTNRIRFAVGAVR